MPAGMLLQRNDASACICERPDLLAREKVAAGAQIQSNSPLELLWILENAVSARVEWNVLPQRGYLSKSNDPSR